MNEMFVSFFSSGLWAVIKAVLLLLLAFAISFGIGGRDFARKVLKKISDTCGLEHEEKK